MPTDRVTTTVVLLLSLVLPAAAQPAPFTPPRAEAGLAAGTAAEADPTLTFDKLTLVFASARTGGAGGRDLWLAERPSAAADWATVSAVPGPGLASPFDEWAPAMDPTGTWLAFASNRPGGPGGGDVWFTTRPHGAAAFAPPQILAGINTPFNETDPTLSADCLELFYVSDFPVGGPGRHVWRATRASASLPFQNAMPVLELDGIGEEIGPALARDGLMLLFASDRAGGSGFDIWAAARPDLQSPFTSPQRVSELSTPGDDLGVTLCYDDWTAYLTQPVAGTARILRADRSLPQVEAFVDPEVDHAWQVWTRAPEHSLAFLFLAPLAIPPVTLPGIGGALELDPTTAMFLHVGACDASERAIARLAIPAADNLIGLELHFQSLVDEPGDSLRKFAKRLKKAIRRVVDKLQGCVSDLKTCTRNCGNQLPDIVERCARSELYMLYYGPTAYAQAVASCTQSAVQACLTNCAWAFARCALR